MNSDTFSLATKSGTPIEIQKNDIAWPSDRNGRYKNPNLPK
jgi:hypothetical protein